jgi:hypothetical protein
MDVPNRVVLPESGRGGEEEDGEQEGPHGARLYPAATARPLAKRGPASCGTSRLGHCANTGQKGGVEPTVRVGPLLALVLGGCCGLTPPGAWCEAECRRTGACQVRVERAGDGVYRCYAGSDADCLGSEGCTAYGRCAAAEDGACVRPEEVASRRCATSVMCRAWGGCHPRDGFCEPRGDADCAESLACLTQGRCLHDSRRGCVATPEECARTTGCALEGLCSWEPHPAIVGGGGRCALTSTGDCTATVACARDGRCAARRLDGCRDGCRVFYCGRPEALTAPMPCTEGSGRALLACEPDGRCMRNAVGECEHVAEER